MESLRAGRTRYLVVVSRPASKKAQITSTAVTTVGISSRKCTSPINNTSKTNNEDQLPSTSDVAISHTNANDDDKCISSFLTTSYQNQSNNSNVSSQNSANMTTAIVDNSSCDIDPQQYSNSNHNCNNNYNNFTQCSNIQDDIQQCDNESTIGSSCSSKSSSNEIEESCLLGIDCNDKTTVGLVLKVLADTAIRLDGDG